MVNKTMGPVVLALIVLAPILVTPINLAPSLVTMYTVSSIVVSGSRESYTLDIPAIPSFC